MAPGDPPEIEESTKVQMLLSVTEMTEADAHQADCACVLNVHVSKTHRLDIDTEIAAPITFQPVKKLDAKVEC